MEKTIFGHWKRIKRPEMLKFGLLMLIYGNFSKKNFWVITVDFGVKMAIFFTKICQKIISASMTYLCLTAYTSKSIRLALLKVISKTAYTPVDMIWHLDCVSGSKTWYLFKKNKKSTLSEKLPKIDKLYQPI